MLLVCPAAKSVTCTALLPPPRPGQDATDSRCSLIPAKSILCDERPCRLVELNVAACRQHCSRAQLQEAVRTGQAQL